MMKGCDGELKIAPVRSEKLTLANRRLQSTYPCQRSESGAYAECTHGFHWFEARLLLA